MKETLRHATTLDLWRIVATGQRQRVLHLNPPYTLVQPESAFSELFRAQVPARRKVSFVYVYAEGGSLLGYIQIKCRWRKYDEWAISTIAVSDRAGEHVWEALLEHACKEAGERGATRLSVKIPKGEPLQEAFRTLGFTHYTDERIWGNLLLATSDVPKREPDPKPLRRQNNSDAWDLMQLYTAITPPAVRRAEELTTRQWRRSSGPRFPFLSRSMVEKAYVWPDEATNKGGLGGYARLLSGVRGHWITFMFRHEGENRAHIPHALNYVLWKASRLGHKPVYCGIREYQSEAEAPLQDRGFHPLSEQELLVKYLVRPIPVRQPALVPFLVPRDEGVGVRG